MHIACTSAATWCVLICRRSCDDLRMGCDAPQMTGKPGGGFGLGRINRHQSIPDQHAHLTAMMRGHYARCDHVSRGDVPLSACWRQLYQQAAAVAQWSATRSACHRSGRESSGRMNVLNRGAAGTPMLRLEDSPWTTTAPAPLEAMNAVKQLPRHRNANEAVVPDTSAAPPPYRCSQ
jgi:hypothetical protein